MRKIVRLRLQKFIQKHATAGQTLDLGGGSGPYVEYFPNRLGFDIAPGPGVDLVGDAHDLSHFADDTFDCVLCTEVLEHLHTPQRAIDEIHRVLKPGGKLILTTRFIFPLHNIPADYFRFTRYGLEYLLRRFEIKEIMEEATSMGTLAVLYERFAFQTEFLGSKMLARLIWWLASRLVLFESPLVTREYGDVTHREAIKHIMTSGYYICAVKKT